MIINLSELTPTQRRKFCLSFADFQLNKQLSDATLVFGRPQDECPEGEVNRHIQVICDGYVPDKIAVAKLALASGSGLCIYDNDMPSSPPFAVNYMDLLSSAVDTGIENMFCDVVPA